MTGPGIPVYQTGLMTPRDLARFDSNGLIADVGTTLGNAFGYGVNPFAITDNGNVGLALNSAKVGGAYNALTLGHDANGNALLTLDSYGGLANKTLYFRKNGTLYEFPFSLTGIVGPVSTTSGNVAVWNNTTGSLLRDAGFPPVQGSSPSVAGHAAVWNNTGGTLLADAGFAPVQGPNPSVAGHVPILANTTGTLLADPTGTTASVLLNRLGNYSSSSAYGGTLASAGLIEVLGSASAPDATQDAVAIFQKWSNSTTNYNAGINPTIYVSNILQIGSDTSRGVAAHFEGQLNVNAATINNFAEGVRTHGTIAPGISGGSVYGIVSVAAEGAGSTHFGYLVGSESEVVNNSADATYSFGTGNSTLSHFEANYLATARGTKKSFAAFMVNAFTAASAAWQVGFYVPAASPNVSLAPVAGAAFRSDAPTTWGIDLTGHGAGPTFAALGSANNIPSVRGTLADGSQNPILLLLDGSNILHLGGDDLPARIDIGTAAVPTRVMKYLDFLATTAPAQPAAGNMRVYMDVADGKLKAIGQAGTVTTLANP